MNKFHLFTAYLLVVVLSSSVAAGQSFRKGSLLVSISEGTTYANYATNNNSAGNEVVTQGNYNGNRDPLFIEYGLSDHLGIGVDLGTDIYNINPSSFYNFQTSTNSVKALMTEISTDVNYHFYNTKKVDLSAFTSVGISSVTLKGNSGDGAYSYSACGGIIRLGAKARYYVFRRVGIMGMLSAFANSCSANGITGNTAGNNYTTSIKGFALEFGICYRILR